MARSSVALVPPARRPVGDSTSQTRDTARVLIVEDERIVAADLQRTLRQLGYDAYAYAPSAAKALALAAQIPPDVVLADIRIDGPVDGIDVAFELRRLYGAAVIFLTAHADDPTVERAKHAEPAGYLIKPITAPAVKAAVEIAIDRKLRGVMAQAFEHSLTQVSADMLCALNHLPMALYLEDSSGRISHVNPALLALFALSEARLDLFGRDGVALMGYLRSRCSDPAYFDGLALALRRSQQAVTGDVISLVDGRKVELDYVPVFQGSRRHGQLWIFRDISVSERERKALEDCAARQRQEMLIDPLTGITNRRGFFELCLTYLKLMRCTGGRKRVLFFIDLNGLKAINDRGGHAAGDRALCAVAEGLRATFRASDLIARIGGDEFVALAALMPDEIENVKLRMSARLREQTRAGSLEVSMGAAEYYPGETIDQLVARADQAMYCDKRSKQVRPAGP